MVVGPFTVCGAMGRTLSRTMSSTTCEEALASRENGKFRPTHASQRWYGVRFFLLPCQPVSRRTLSCSNSRHPSKWSRGIVQRSSPSARKMSLPPRPLNESTAKTSFFRSVPYHSHSVDYGGTGNPSWLIIIRALVKMVNSAA